MTRTFSDHPLWQGSSVRSRSVRAYERLDAAFFADTFTQAKEAIALIEAAGILVVPLNQIGRVWDPPRFARAWATPQEEGVPYLRPYDVFDYLPDATQRLSTGRNRGIGDLRLTSGTILQTCSGRNLGPNTVVDNDLSGYCLSHDMVRIDIDDETTRLYVLAYLKSEIGQTLIRRNRSGSVIDHISAEDVGSVVVPFIAEPTMQEVASRMKEAATLRGEARRELRWALDQVSHPIAGMERWVSWQHKASVTGQV